MQLMFRGLRSCVEIAESVSLVKKRQEQQLWSVPGLACEGFIKGDSAAIAKAREWKVDVNATLEAVLASKNRSRMCTLIAELFAFRTAPLSQEEADFPLAYGILVHKDFIQFLLMLSSFYHPQNVYCIAVSGGASQSFLRLIHGLLDCFDNVHVIQVDRVRWGSFEVIHSVHKCMSLLDTLKKPDWRYFQYLSGVDVPLRTNLEMVRIRRVLNGSINAEVSNFQQKRLATKKGKKPPLPLFKSSLSALLPRAAVHVLVHERKQLVLMGFLNGTLTPDESYWATVAGNPQLLQLPGGWNASEILAARKKNGQPARQCSHSPCISGYYISRFQIWKKHGVCRGMFKSTSCVFGVADLVSVLRMPHLVAHKLYLSFEQAALFCALRKIRAVEEIDRRSREPDPLFNHLQYAELPQVELSRGVPFTNISHPEWLT